MFPYRTRLGLVAGAATVCWPTLSAAQQVGPTPQPQSVPITVEEAEEVEPEVWAAHAQSTLVTQYHPGFPAAFSGPNTLDPHEQARETFDLTLYAGVRPWSGAELWVNPEVDQGFGLSGTLGVAGFPSAEAYKVGASNPYPRIPRVFFRQMVDLSGDTEQLEADLNQLAMTQTANRVVLTLGKFSVVDVFAHQQIRT